MGLFINQDNILAVAKQDVLKILHSAKECTAAIEENLILPPKPDLGDLSFPLFTTAKQQDMAPGQLAQDLQRKLKPQGLIEKISAAGPYLNFWLDKEKVVKAIITPPAPPRSLGYARDRLLRGGKRGVLPLKLRVSERGLQGQKIMMEMISPNNNKPLHLGHLRNAFLGESVSRLLESQGAKVVRACLFNDRGLHIAKAMLGYKLWAQNQTAESARIKGDQFVVQWYVLFEQKSKQDPALLKQAEELVRKWEAGDKQTIALWEKISGWALDGINQTFQRLGIKFDAFYFESKLWKQGKKIVEQGLKKDIFIKDKTGAVIAEFPNLPPKVLVRSDGTAIYATADLALTPEKFKTYKLDRAIWCVGQEQDLYLKQHFAIMKALGRKWAEKCEHLSYGLVSLPEGRMKTREGTVVEADPFLDEMEKLTQEQIKERHAHLTEQEIQGRAEIIAQAALRYYFLKVGPKNAVHFDPKSSISFTGDTGPYLLYTYARIASILRKSQITNHKSQTNSKYKITNLEWTLIVLLARFTEIIAQAASDRDPSHLAKYLYSLSQKFSDFYEKEPVLKVEEPTRAFRLSLLIKIQSVLKQGLYLLGIGTVEEM